MFKTATKIIWRGIGKKIETSIKVVHTDGELFCNKPGTEPEVTIHYRKYFGYVRSALFTNLGFAEAYILGDIDIEGDLMALVLAADDAAKETGGKLSHNPLAHLLNVIHEWHFSNRSIKQAKKNALYHYNRGTEMFRLYLDPTMTYTCAYWKEGTKNLADAQTQKIDHSLRKLRLKAGETLVDVGGGWGSVLFRAFEKYGVIGTNVSPTPDQNKAMQAEIKRRGYVGKVKIKEIDFREDTEVYDKYISLGVYEHAGRDQLDAWIKTMSASLKPGGIGLLHFIGNPRPGIEQTGIFIRKHVFPGGYLPGLGETIEIMDKYGLEILDVENLRRHYYFTLKAWAENFDAHFENIQALDPKRYDEKFRRLWRFYLYTCAAVFKRKHTTHVGLYQIVFSKGRDHAYPMTRDFLYQTDKPQ
jgi:cyclopropane-fatty-acyl-phospholipid synthase